MDNCIEKIIENNKSFVEEMLKNDPEYFKKLSKGQSPSILYIGCSDSRMPITSFTKTLPGEIFIHRNIGNQIFVNDMNALAVIEYAVKVLDVKYIIIAGHYQCGAVKAVFDYELYDKNPIVNDWISGIRELYISRKNEIDKIIDIDKKADFLSELNVVYQIQKLLKTSIMKNRFKYKPYPKILGWIIDIYSGYIKSLDIPTKEWKELGLLPIDY